MNLEESKKVYISYARKADNSLIKQLEKWNDKELHNRWQIVYDEKYLSPGGQIDAFEKELGGADNVIILLSGKYFQSVDCMTELQYLYQKCAAKLLPISVFVGANGVQYIDESKIISNWQTKRDKYKKKKKEEAASKCDDIAEQLPLLLAWLLGKFDRKMNRYGTVFPVLEKQDSNCYQSVFSALERETKLRYPFLSGAEKTVIIQKEINGAVQRVPDEVTNYLSAFATALGCNKNGLACFLTKESSAGHIERVLEILDGWLGNLAEYASVEPSNGLVFLAKVVKKMLSWFLLMVFDDRQLHILTHWLNRNGADANLELLKESESSLQLLTSALVVLPAIFSFQRAEGNSSRLTGKGELVLNEAGIGSQNKITQLERAVNWRQLYVTLQEQNGKLGGEYGTLDALESALGFEFKRNAFYLIFEDVFKVMAVEQKVRQTLGEKFPELTQIMLPESDKNEMVGRYLIDGLDIAVLDRYIRHIYGHIEVMTQK